MSDSRSDDRILDLIYRTERGLQHAHDGEILIEALKSAVANSYLTDTEYVNRLHFHIQRGFEAVKNKPKEH